MKKLKFTFLAIFLMAMAMPRSAFAYDFSAVAPTGQTLYYQYVESANDVELCYPGYNDYHAWSGYTTPTGALTIPLTVTYNGTTYNVTSIGDYAFYSCSGLTSITIPNSVTSIGREAFRNCTGLTTVNFNAIN